MSGQPFNPDPQSIEEYIREIRRDVKDIVRQTTATNGRVGALEEWRRKQEEKEKVTTAFREGAASKLFSKKQVATGITAVGLVAGAVGSVVGAIAKVAS